MSNKLLNALIRFSLCRKEKDGQGRARARQGFSKETVRKILVINTTAIGDTLLSTPAIRALDDAFPDATITALVGSSAKEVLKGNPRVDDLLDRPGGRVDLSYVLRFPGFVRQLKRARFDLAVVLHGNDPDAVPIAYLSGAPVRLGMVQTEFDSLLTWYRPPGSASHVIDEKLSALSPLGIEATDRRMEFYLTQADEAEAAKLLDEAEIAAPLVSIHPFGSKKTRHWPVEHAARLADMLYDEFGWRPVILGGAREVEKSRALASMISAPTFETAGKMRFRTSAAIMKASEMVVTTDSGPLHMAQALGVPTVALFGAATPDETGPLERNSIVVSKDGVCDMKRPCVLRDCPDLVCMKAIEPEEVLDGVRRLLSLQQ